MNGQLWTIILVAVVLGADAFSLSMGMGIKGASRRYAMRFSILVGLFHIFMPLLGLSLGLAAGKFLGVWAGRMGAVVLLYIGLEMIWKSYQELKMREVTFTEARESLSCNDSERNADGWVSLLVLTISVSIDALTVGFSLGTIKAPILFTVIIMGIIAGSMTMLGFKGGKILSRAVGSYSQAVGGLVLLALAFKMAF
ncbi:MAG TPA: manganese efflux pump MntP family protein [Syntrophomonas sp.]|nr:manganese efflux pump MntP family protein [Syntrophomonas sp.]